MENESYVKIRELKRLVDLQSQYLNRYLKDDAIVEGLRVHVHKTDYHQTKIHEEDLEEVATRINQRLEEKGIK